MTTSLSRPSTFIRLIFLFLLFANPAPAVFAEENLGRLFFTPERRQNLDRQRQMNIQSRPEVPEDPTLTINGVVTRSSGKRTVWVNGVAQNENDATGDITLLPQPADPGRITVQTGATPASQAKVGDTVNRTTGDSIDLLGDGSITRTRPRGSGGK